MDKLNRFAYFSSTICFLFLLGVGCRPKLEEHQFGSINKPVAFGVRNLTVVEIIPGGDTVNIDWKGYDTITGNAFKVGYEEIRVYDSEKTYLITDKEGGNNQLVVNGVKYTFDAKNKHLVVRFGVGIEVAPGASYATAKHVYDDNVFSVP